jgi:hypothetical protein
MPAFRYPEILKFKGAPVFVGREDGSATTTGLGGGGPHLLVVGHCTFTLSKPVFKAPMGSALETII